MYNVPIVTSDTNGLREKNIKIKIILPKKITQHLNNITLNKCPIKLNAENLGQSDHYVLESSTLIGCESAS